VYVWLQVLNRNENLATYLCSSPKLTNPAYIKGRRCTQCGAVGCSAGGRLCSESCPRVQKPDCLILRPVMFRRARPGSRAAVVCQSVTSPSPAVLVAYWSIQLPVNTCTSATAHSGLTIWRQCISTTTDHFSGRTIIETIHVLHTAVWTVSLFTTTRIGRFEFGELSGFRVPKQLGPRCRQRAWTRTSCVRTGRRRVSALPMPRSC
jgi:hypothetical protein